VRLARPRSFLRTGLPTPLSSPLNWLPNPQSRTPRSGYRGSDLVLWHDPETFGAGGILSGFRGISAAPAIADMCARLLG
jgi:hypothetical protein